jgi:CBS domain containing-hemolysin-like protein
VRDTLTAAPDVLASDIARDALVVSPETSAYDALARMRRGRVQLATVVQNDRLLGVVTLDDLLREVLPASSSQTR